MIESGGLLGSLLRKLACPVMKVAVPLAKKVLAPLGLTATMSAIDAGIQVMAMMQVMVLQLKKKGLIPAHPLTSFEIKEYYENEPRLNGVYSRDQLPKTIKNGAYVINLDEYADAGTNWIALYVKNNKVIYFDSFGVEHVPKATKRFIGYKNTKTNIFRI